MNNQTPDHAPEQGSDPGRETGPEGLLSAYLDGELTAEETGAVEAHLESSKESRRTLDELRLLSSYLSNLAPEAAPESLRSSILASHSTPQPTPQRTTRSFRGPLIAAVVAVAALVMVAVIPHVSPWSPSRSDTDDPGLVVLAETPAEQPVTSADASAGVGNFAEGARIAGGGELVFDKTPDKAQVGQILSAIDTSDGQAVVVRLTVVDIEQGLNSLRLLLQKHQIASVDTLPSANRDATRRRKGDGSRFGDGQLVSVVVRASSEQVSEAMASLRREVVSEMELAGVVHVAVLETAPGGRRALEQLQSYSGKTLRTQPVGPAGDAPNSTPAGGDRAFKSASRPAPRDKPALASAQVRLDLPADLMRQVSRARGDARPSATTRFRSERQLQIVFVLVAAPRPVSSPPSEPDGAA